MDHQDGHHDHAAQPHLELMPVAHATHVAVSNGAWDNPATWAGGKVPGDGALVHIPADVSVFYEGASDARLFIVRVDGALDFHAGDGAATRMIVDTIITSAGAHLGLYADGPGDGTIDIVFAEGTPTAHGAHYTDHSQGDGVIGRHDWDPEQLSLGLVASGEVEVRGRAVDAGIQLAEGPRAGATEITFDVDADATGWAPGQQIVIGGTAFLGDGADGKLMTQDEVRTITSVEMIDGQMVVGFDTPLAHDHTGATNPQTGAELTGFVGNLSRAITFSSAVADGSGDGMADRAVSLGEDLGDGEHYVTQRGHVMFMHNDDVTVSDAAFFGLGRTDKSLPVDDFVTGGSHGNNRLFADHGIEGVYDPEMDFALRTPPEEIMNQRGRYPVHLHMANGHDDQDHDHGVIGPCPDTGGPICTCGDRDGDGTPDCEDPDNFDGAMLSGNVIWGSPGWGLVQHSSAAELDGNLAFDVAGSAFVAELGDETGRWADNLAIGTYGAREEAPNEDSEAFNEDAGAGGIGFYVKARAIDMIDNTAQGSGRAGWFYHNSGADQQKTAAVEDGRLDLVAQGRDAIPTEDVPLALFDGNTVIAAREGLRITTDPSDSVRKFNDVWSHLTDFTAWEVDESGVSITYSSKYLFENFLIIGTGDKVSGIAQKASSGFYFKTSVADITVLNSHVENFEHAYTNWSFIGDRQEYRRGLWDPRDPAESPWVDIYEGMGAVEGIENPIHNLFNHNLVGLTYENLTGGPHRIPAIEAETAEGGTAKMRGYEVYEDRDALSVEGVTLELLGDSRDGGLVALWREDIARDPTNEEGLVDEIPLAYRDQVYLSQIHFADGDHATRWTYRDHVENINDDIWSGTLLEFAKEDSLGRQVFLYGDFAPLDPGAAERTVTSNERLVISKEMIDGTLVKDGFYRVDGIRDVKFVVITMGFTDRLTGEVSARPVLVALDLAWELPEGAVDAGLLWISDDMVVAPQYRVFDNGVLVEDRPPIVLGAVPEGLTEYQTGGYTTDADERLALSGGSDKLHAAGGDDVVRGYGGTDLLDGGAGHDALFGGGGWDRLIGGDGDDLLDGHAHRDVLFGGAGDDRLQGGNGADDLDGGDGDDILLGGQGRDVVFGGAGNDLLDGAGQSDRLYGGDGHDQAFGGTGFDTIDGGAGDDVIAGHGGSDRLFGGAGDDLINGGQRDDRLFGGTGADHLLGEAGRDRMYGGDGDDLLEGHAGSDVIEGGAGDDGLAGGYGQDRLDGGDGNDVLSGGQQRDVLTGGSGADRFVFDGSSGMDVITDFEDGIDAIEFMIQAFDYQDLTIHQAGSAAVVEHDGGVIRLPGVSASDLDESDFRFSDPDAA